jgi:hypothetical protein
MRACVSTWLGSDFSIGGCDVGAGAGSGSFAGGAGVGASSFFITFALRVFFLRLIFTLRAGGGGGGAIELVNSYFYF